MSRTENLDRILRWLLADARQSAMLPDTLGDKQRMMRALMNLREPRPMSEEFLAWQDAELALQREERGVVDIDGEGLHLWQGDITRLRVDAIVNAANAQMLGCFVPLHACIDNCIHSAAGLQLREECHQQMQGRELPTGQAVITRGYTLPARHVIHTVGPIIDTPRGIHALPTQQQQEQLAACYANSLALASAEKLRSIAFCCISTGVFHFPNELAAQIAVRTVCTWLDEHPGSTVRTVVFNVFLDKDLMIYQQLL